MSTLTGTGSMMRLAWRRNWLFWLLWTLCLATMMPLTASQYDTILPPGTDPRATLEPLRTNPSMLALLGPVFDLYSKGGFVFWRVGGFCSMFAGMLGGFAIIRATRAEEEEGRHELLRSGVVGRHAPLAGALLMCLSGSLALWLVTSVLVLATGLPTAGAVAAGGALGLECMVFVGLGAVAAQIWESARSARYWTLGALWGGMFVLRMVIDGAGSDAPRAWLRWLVPMEWGMLLRPWADERWWVALLPLLLTVVCIVLAFRLESRRDHLAGLRTARPGPDRAPSWMQGANGLAWRLQRGGLLGWSVGLVLCSMGTGSIMSQMDASIEANPQMGEMLQKMGGTENLQVAFYGAMTLILATVVAIMAASVLFRLRAEEAHGHAEQLLATPTSRTRLVWSHLSLALVVPSLVLVAIGASMPFSQAQAKGDWSLVWQYLQCAAGLLPGLWLVTGLAMALLGWFPRWTAVTWALLGWTMFCTWFVVLFDLPDWVVRLHPWGHLALLPRDAMDWPVFVLETVAAIALLVVGLTGYGRRGIPS